MVKVFFYFHKLKINVSVVEDLETLSGISNIFYKLKFCNRKKKHTQHNILQLYEF